MEIYIIEGAKVLILNPSSPKGGVVPTPLTVLGLVLKIAKPRGKVAPGTFNIINDNDMLSYSLTTMMCFLTKE